LSTPIKQSYVGFLNPILFILAGLAFLLAGFAITYFYGQKGVINLEVGKINSLKIDSNASDGADQSATGLGLAITLDSLRIHPYTPEYEINLWKKETTSSHAKSSSGTSSTSLVGVFPMEPMKITKIDTTDLRFRLKEFYPNFQFSYQYPSVRDTIKPRAPGITLELKTKEGLPIVTLRSDQPKKHLLGDIVSLGASLEFYWNIPIDSVKEIAVNNVKGVNKIVFSGADTTIYFLLEDSISTQPLNENVFYTLPGQDSTGFTVLFCYPDVALLKAVPSSKGNEMTNPVAHVEIWKEGGNAIDAFLYPETRGRKGGDFEIPASDYKLGLSVNKEKAKKHCDCTISVQKDSSVKSDILTIVSGKPVMYHGYRFSPVECSDRFPGGVIMEIGYMPGRTPIIIGLLLTGIALLLFLSKRFQANQGQKA